MASLEHSLVVVFSSLLVASSYSFPSLRLLFQDGVARDSVKIRSLHANSPTVATGLWEWKMAGEESHESPPLPRRKREMVFSTESSNVSIPETTTLLLLEDETTESHPLEEDETSQPGMAGNGSSPEATATSHPLRDAATEAAGAHFSTVVGTVPFYGQMTTADLSEDFTETVGTKNGSHLSFTMGTTWPTSTATSQTLAATSAISVVTLGSDAESGVKTTGSTSSSLSSPVAKSRPLPTVQTRPSSKEGPEGPDKVLGQCLLAISLLALIAGIFIIATFVLAALLLRQKRAYKLRQHNHTEMVCISSLLAAEEAEASGGRLPRPKRVKALAENGSETDMDNLTLNSFLPDH